MKCIIKMKKATKPNQVINQKVKQVSVEYEFANPNCRSIDSVSLVTIYVHIVQYRFQLKMLAYRIIGMQCTNNEFHVEWQRLQMFGHQVFLVMV